MNYIERFEKLGFGMFVHFGLYSVVGKGECYLQSDHNPDINKYQKLTEKFKVAKNWAQDIVKTAKSAGCKYITITTRHHDGFSLYDTCGLNNFDAPHSACKRDLIKEFVDECNKNDIVPFFYHTLLDWYNCDYNADFSKYIDYLIKSVELLCTNYGKIGGLWFDGMWDKPKENWQEDRLYATIRKHQPEAMIINNTGLSELGKVGHREIDSVTFERGKPAFVDNTDKHRAGEMCQVLNDHWGYAKDDCNYKPIRELIENLVDCRSFNCNFLLNIGPLGSGKVKLIDKCILKEIGKWIRANKNFIYNVKASELTAKNAFVLKDDKYYYAVMKDIPMKASMNVTFQGDIKDAVISKKIKNAVWLDNGGKIEIENDNKIISEPFIYGTSYSVRVARFELKS